MIVTSLNIKNLKSFDDSGEIKFSPGINILIGPNNGGKSTVVESIYQLQQGSLDYTNVRKGKNFFEIVVGLSALDKRFDSHALKVDSAKITIKAHPSNRSMYTNFFIQKKQDPNNYSFGTFSDNEPNNFIYPFFSNRKSPSYNEEVRNQNAISVLPDLRNLSAKIDRVSNDQRPSSKEYKEECKNILGIVISSLSSNNGKLPGLSVGDFESIQIQYMGDGTPNVIGLLQSLCSAENKLFLIEEIENDIHPKALKKLLEVIERKSSNNQFIISTHSNIITKYLGAVKNSKIFYVDVDFSSDLPTSSVKEIVSNDERMDALKELGYELGDFGLHEGWLLLEESSAEKIIREYLIPWFVESLVGKIKTVASGGESKVSKRFDDFHRMVLYTHLEAIYKNKTWVMIDGGVESRQVIEKLKDDYCGTGSWKEDNFINFSRENFEEYYPDKFKDEVSKVLKTTSKQKKREKKKELLNKVLNWIEKDPKLAKEEFEKSAEEVITKLKEIKL